MPFVILQSSDDKKFYIDIEVAKHFGTIKNLLSCCSTDSEPQGIIPLPNVDENTLNKVLDWINHHITNPTTYIQYTKDECPLDAWDKEFLTVGKEVLFKLLIAANYLDIPGLIHVTAKEIANMMEGKTPQEIRDTFNIENDFSREEEEQIWLENQWFTQN